MSTAAPSLDSIADILAFQENTVREGKFEYIGHVWTIVTEPAAGAAVPGPEVTNRVGSRLDFYDSRDGRQVGPRIAQTLDKSTLLVLDPIVRPDGKVGLPDIPQPDWIPPVPSHDQVTNGYDPPKAPLVPQRLTDRARGQFPKGRGDYLVFGPIAQILIRPEGLPEGWIAYCGGDNSGRQMDLLVKVANGQAHFVYGNFQIHRAGRV